MVSEALSFTAHWAAHSKGKSESTAKRRYAKYLKRRGAKSESLAPSPPADQTEVAELEAWIDSDVDKPELLSVIHNQNEVHATPAELAERDLEPKLRDPETGLTVIIRSWKKISQIGNDGANRVKIAPKYYNKTGRGLIGTSEKNISQSLERF